MLQKYCNLSGRCYKKVKITLWRLAMKRSLSVLSVVSLLGFAGSAFAAAAVDGAKLLEERCSVCHKSDRPKAAKKSMAEWDSTVTRMMGKGAKLSEAEKKALVDHLAKTYKP
jgi:cytochrome c5